VHHLGVVVDSLDAYFDTRDRLGLMLEAVEPPARMPPFDFGWPP